MIMVHRVVNYAKSEADNPSAFLLMVKTKYLEAFTYIASMTYLAVCSLLMQYYLLMTPLYLLLMKILIIFSML